MQQADEHGDIEDDLADREFGVDVGPADRVDEPADDGIGRAEDHGERQPLHHGRRRPGEGRPDPQSQDLVAEGYADQRREEQDAGDGENAAADQGGGMRHIGPEGRGHGGGTRCSSRRSRRARSGRAGRSASRNSRRRRRIRPTRRGSGRCTSTPARQCSTPSSSRRGARVPRACRQSVLAWASDGISPMQMRQ